MTAYFFGSDLEMVIGLASAIALAGAMLFDHARRSKCDNGSRAIHRHG